jgi:hypothetical protein
MSFVFLDCGLFSNFLLCPFDLSYDADSDSFASTDPTDVFKKADKDALTPTIKISIWPSAIFIPRIKYDADVNFKSKSHH